MKLREYIAAHWKKFIEALKKRRTAIVHNQGEPKPKGNGTEYNPYGEKIVTALELIHDQAKANAERRDAEEKTKIAWEKRRFWLDVCGVIAAFFAAFVLFCQQNIMQGQLNEMQAERRPWINVDIAVGDITWDKTGIQIPLTFELKNTGHSPAMNVWIGAKVIPFITRDMKDNAFGVLASISGERRKQKAGFDGFTVFPGDQMPIGSPQTLPREDIEKFIKFMAEFRGAGEAPPPQPPPPPKDMPLVVVYVVDYSFDSGEDHHQTRCWAYIDRIDHDRPNGPGLAIPMDTNISSKELKILISPFDCKAD